MFKKNLAQIMKSFTKTAAELESFIAQSDEEIRVTQAQVEILEQNKSNLEYNKKAAADLLENMSGFLPKEK